MFFCFLKLNSMLENKLHTKMPHTHQLTTNLTLKSLLLSLFIVWVTLFVPGYLLYFGNSGFSTQCDLSQQNRYEFSYSCVCEHEIFYIHKSYNCKIGFVLMIIPTIPVSMILCGIFTITFAFIINIVCKSYNFIRKYFQ
jgi:hypothetical protein